MVYKPNEKPGTCRFWNALLSICVWSIILALSQRGEKSSSVTNYLSCKELMVFTKGISEESSSRENYLTFQVCLCVLVVFVSSFLLLIFFSFTDPVSLLGIHRLGSPSCAFGRDFLLHLHLPRDAEGLPWVITTLSNPISINSQCFNVWNLLSDHMGFVSRFCSALMLLLKPLQALNLIQQWETISPRGVLSPWVFIPPTFPTGGSGF